MKEIRRKLLSLLLSASMIISIVPVNAFATEIEHDNSEVITAISVPQEVKQEITQGSEVTPVLPDELTATLTKIEWKQVTVQDVDTETQTPSDVEDKTGENNLTKEEWQSTVTTEDVTVAVNWTLPEGETFSTESEKEFVYTASLKEDTYKISSDVVMPQITVLVVGKTPDVVQPTPDVVQPTPDVVQPTPDGVQPTPDVVQPTPDVIQPTPDVVQPTPDVAQPTPDVAQKTQAVANVLSTGDLTVTNGVQPADYSYENGVLTIKSSTAMTISGATTTDRIVVATGVTANITLNGVDIDSDLANPIELQNNANLTLTLEGQNRLAGGVTKAGIRVPESTALTINGTGSLEATGGRPNRDGGGAGIGANTGENLGTITVDSGTINTNTLTGGGAGIGLGGWGGSGGSIIINGGNITSSGNGSEGSFFAQTITINGGIIQVFDTKLDSVAKNNCILFKNENGQVYGNPVIKMNSTITSGKNLTIGKDQTLTIAENVTFVNDGIINSEGAITNNGTTTNNGTIKNKGTITNSGTFTNEEKIENDGTITNTGTITNNRRIVNYGNINNSGTLVNNDGILNLGNIEGDITGNQPVIESLSFSDFTIISTNGESLVDGTDFNFDVKTKILTIKSSKAITISGTTTTDNIVVETGVTANITLNGVNIDSTSSNAIELQNDANLTLTLQGQNRLAGGATKAGIRVPESTSLTINGTGSLDVTGGRLGSDGGGAGIGANKAESLGSITVESGTIDTRSLNGGGAGIGNGGWGGSEGTIIINGGNIISRGCGSEGSFFAETIIINGGIVQVFDDKLDVATKDNCIIAVNNVCKIYGPPVIKENMELPGNLTLEISSDTTLTVEAGVTFINKGTIINNGTIVNNGVIDNTTGLYIGELPSGNGEFKGMTTGVENPSCNIENNSVYLQGSGDSKRYSVGGKTWQNYTGKITITGTTTRNTVVVQSGNHDITIEELNINVASINNLSAFDIQGSSNVNLTLKQANTLKSGESRAGLQVGQNASVVIKGDGSVVAHSGRWGAGIGGASHGNSGAITIKESVTVEARSDDGGAAIGSGHRADAGPITIQDDVIVKAVATTRWIDDGAGIGSGYSGDCSSITINGGTVTAVGCNDSANIGGGLFGDSGRIVINGGRVIARGSGIGIGGGSPNTFSTGENGTAFISSNSILDLSNRSNWGGIILYGEDVVVGGEQTLTEDVKINTNKTLEVLEDSILTVKNGVTIDGLGTIKNNGKIINEGTITSTDGIFLGVEPTGNGLYNPPTTRNITVIGGNASLVGSEEVITKTSKGQQIQITPTDKIPDGQYIIWNITGCDKKVATANPYIFTMPANDVSIEIGYSSIEDYTHNIGAGRISMRENNGKPQYRIGGDDQNWITYTGNMTITGTSRGSGVVVESGTHNITLDNAKIDIGGCAFEIEGSGKANLTLKGDNVLNSGSKACIKLGDNATVVIDGTGKLDAVGNDRYWVGGIGDNDTATIIIKGGTISVRAGYSKSGMQGNITISGGNVTSIGGGYGGGIAGPTFSTGENGNAIICALPGVGDKTKQDEWQGIIFEPNDGKVYGEVTLTQDMEIPNNKTLEVLNGSTLIVDTDVTLDNLGTITNNGSIICNGTINSEDGTYIGKEPTGSGVTNLPKKFNVTVNGGKATYEGTDDTLTSVSTRQKVEVSTIIPTGKYLKEWKITGLNGVTSSDSNPYVFTMPESDVEFTAVIGDIKDYSHDISTSSLYLRENNDRPEYSTDNQEWIPYTGNVTVTGTTTSNEIGVKSGEHNITLDGVNIDASARYEAFIIYPGSTVNLTLKEDTINIFKSGGWSPAISVEGYHSDYQGSLIINGTGTLNATGGQRAPGIGALRYLGNIVINSGTVIATGGEGAPGIGAEFGLGNIIVINGGTVIATGGERAPGIGSIYDDGDCNITIATTLGYTTSNQEITDTAKYTRGTGVAQNNLSMGRYVKIKEYIPSTATDITDFNITNQEGVTTVDKEKHTVELTMPFGTDVTSLEPKITLSENATVNPDTGIACDFTNAVTYTVVAEDGKTTQDWTVTVKIGIDPNIAIIANAKTVIEKAEFANKAQGITEAELKDYVTEVVTTAVDNQDVALTVTKVSYVEAIAETSATGDGENGTYKFTVTATKGVETATSKELTVTVDYTKFTGVTDAQAVANAIDKAENVTYANPTNANDYADETALANYVKAIAEKAINDSEVIIKVNTVSYTTSVNGTKDNPNGIQGAYKFTITVSKGGKTETMTEKTINLPTIKFETYPVKDGDNQTLTVGTDDNIKFTIDGNFTNFIGLYLNGKLVDTSNYDAKSGSVIITLKSNYVKKLPVGKHVFTLAFTNGEANVNMEIKAISASEHLNPQTDTPQENNNGIMWLYFSLVFVMLSGVSIVGYRRKYQK